MTFADDQDGSNSQGIDITVNPAVACAVNCLSAGKIDLSAFRPRWAPDRDRVKVRERVLDELGQARQGVTVFAIWTLPDGSQIVQSSHIEPGNWKWFAELQIPARQSENYRLHIDNIIAKGWEFDPATGSLQAGLNVSP